MYDPMLLLLTATPPYARTQTLLPPHIRTENRNQAVLFFVQCLCQYLKTEAAGSPLEAEVKLTIRECIQKNRAGDPSFAPLRSALLLKLRRIVGQQHWTRVLLRFDLSRGCVLNSVGAVQIVWRWWRSNDTRCQDKDLFHYILYYGVLHKESLH